MSEFAINKVTSIKVIELNCSKCGNKTELGEEICVKCGHDLTILIMEPEEV